MIGAGGLVCRSVLEVEERDVVFAPDVLPLVVVFERELDAVPVRIETMYVRRIGAC